MKLKNKNSKRFSIRFLKKYINLKNLLVFLIGFFVTAIVIGIIYFLSLDNGSLSSIYTNVDKYFTVSVTSLNVFIKELFSNIFNVFIIWIFGISVIGIFIVLFLLFSEGFGFGVIASSIIKMYNIKGIVGVFLYLFPCKIIYIFILIILSFRAINFSYKLINFLIFKKDIDIKQELKKYFKILVIMIIFSFVYSIFNVFVNPLCIKLWTFFIK